MKEKLIRIVSEIIELLQACGYNDTAVWYKEKLSIIESEESDSKLFITQLRELKRIIAGMGSFSDLSLTPIANSGITKQQAIERQWDLSEELSKAINELLLNQEKQRGRAQ